MLRLMLCKEFFFLLLPSMAVLPLFKIKYPEINSENSWNFTKYPEILQKVSIFYNKNYVLYIFLPGFSSFEWKKRRRYMAGKGYTH